MQDVTSECQIILLRNAACEFFAVLLQPSQFGGKQKLKQVAIPTLVGVQNCCKIVQNVKNQTIKGW